MSYITGSPPRSLYTRASAALCRKCIGKGKHTHTYEDKEMSKWWETLCAECQGVGLDTLPWTELIVCWVPGKTPRWVNHSG